MKQFRLGFYGMYNGKEYYISEINKTNAKIVSIDINDYEKNKFDRDGLTGEEDDEYYKIIFSDSMSFKESLGEKCIEIFSKQIETKELQNIVNIHSYVLYQNEKISVIFATKDSYWVGTNDRRVFGKLKLLKNIELEGFKHTGEIQKEEVEIIEEIENIMIDNLKN
jgi:hypothetical protein